MATEPSSNPEIRLEEGPAELAQDNQLERIFHPYACQQMEAFYKTQRDPTHVRFVHYTSAHAALEIIQTKRMWMRNVTSMSDYSEVQHGFNILNTILSAPANRKQFNEALDGCAPQAGEEAIKFFDQWWTDIRFNTYVTSISEHFDNEDIHGRLSMWRAFGASDVRVAIVFKVPVPVLSAGVFELILSPVAYLTKEEVEEKFQEVLKNVRAEIELLKSLDRVQVVRSVFSMLVAGVTCMKHEGFKEEREWRLVYSPNRWPSQLIERSTEIVRGIPQIVYKIPFDARVTGVPDSLDFTQLFDQLIIGPAQYPWSMVDAFVLALQNAGVAAPRIIPSGIPIRM
jgi:hypothetical protein